MRYKVIFLVSCMVAGLAGQAQPVQRFDREAFYSAMASGDIDTVSNQLLIVQAANLDEKEAYEGALLMLEAGLLTRPADRLKAFRSGQKKLETAILNDIDNGEYRFLRLSIQEHVPRALKYHDELHEDCQYIRDVFEELSPIVRKAILAYGKSSKVLRPETCSVI